MEEHPWPPPGMTGFTAPRKPPAPGTNPQYDVLEALRRDYERFIAETELLIRSTRIRQDGLAASLKTYEEGLAAIKQRQADLLSAS